MRGRQGPQVTLLGFIDSETRLPSDHPLRVIKKLADQALKALSPDWTLVYVVISLTVEDGIAIEVRDEKALLARIVVMYAVVAASCPQKNPAIIACHVAQSNRSSVRWRTAECGRTRAPEFERIAHNNRRTIKRRAIMGLDDVQAGRIKNACNWSEKR